MRTTPMDIQDKESLPVGDTSTTHLSTPGEGTESVFQEEPINITNTDMHKTMQRIRDQESFTMETKWMTIHGFHQGMSDEQVLHAANTLCGNMQLQMNNGDIIEAMEQMTEWQIIVADGYYGICVELTETLTFIISHDFGMNHVVQPFYSNRFGPYMREREGREQRQRFHVQASKKTPSFYKEGLKELIVFRGATFSEDHARPWLHAIIEYCSHQFEWTHVILMRTASNKTPTYDQNMTGRETRCTT